MSQCISAKTAFQCIGRLTRDNYIKLFGCIDNAYTNIVDILVSSVLSSDNAQEVLFDILKQDLTKIQPEDIDSSPIYLDGETINLGFVRFDDEQIRDYTRKCCVAALRSYYEHPENRANTFNTLNTNHDLINQGYIYLNSHEIFLNINDFTFIKIKP